MGRRMIEYSHTSIKRFSMELGGDAPVLIFADVADVKSVVSDVVGLKFANAGQICVSPNRVYVQEEVRWTFLMFQPQGSPVAHNKKKILHEQGYAGMLLDHCGSQKPPMTKSE